MRKNYLTARIQPGLLILWLVGAWFMVTDDVWSWGAVVRVQPAVNVEPASGK